MQKTERPNVVIFLDYIPAELRENKIWEIVYYVINPNTGKLERKRKRVKPLKNKTYRKKLAIVMVNRLNERLKGGWNPYYENKTTKELVQVNVACKDYLNRAQIEFDDDNLRFDSLKTYRSQINLLLEYLEDVICKPELLCYKIDNEFIGNYLDYVRYTKGRSARTRDNYLGFMTTFCKFLLSKKYISHNPTDVFQRINKKTKQRTVISEAQRLEIFEYFAFNDEAFLILCLSCYYCLIRRTELTKIKVKDLNFEKQTLFIDSSDSKNRKSAFVTIPNQLLEKLKDHVSGFSADYYLFSNKGYVPGPTKINPDLISRKWRFMREKLELPKNIHWYSLKDTGITDLLLDGVPLISVRDQARHHSSMQTDSYTPREMRSSDENIKNSKVSF
ncbi:site-specific integrase [Lacinutrix sp. Hel_I_90]|uniref:tyrosine-type recombinase/integrase n=1 Tax=Lacinutrix sp. Hel_I_90 TaxID=1249999 RepID=UPI0005C948B4|nr:site-specific integrase [Lacinutrix sp. Hel_I_90]